MLNRERIIICCLFLSAAAFASASANAPATIKANRSYQIAAANFYAGNFTAAEKMFGQIADDPRAPEALHLSVRATRFGCRDDRTGLL